MAEDNPISKTSRKDVVAMYNRAQPATREPALNISWTNDPSLRQRPRQSNSVGSMESQLARKLIVERRQREELFGPNLFGEPVWDILLRLFVEHDEQKRISVSDLCAAAAVPASTALRWISILDAKHMLVRHPDPQDGRRFWIELSPHIVEQMRQLLAAWTVERT